MKLNRSLLKSKWVTFEEAKGVSFEVRPFPASHNAVRSLSGEDKVEVFWKIFEYCLIDWKGVEGEDNKALECNADNKRMLYDYSEAAMMFIITMSAKNKDKIIEKKT